MIQTILMRMADSIHTVHGAWTAVGTVVLFVILMLVGLRLLRPVSAEVFDEYEFEQLVAEHAEPIANMSATLDA